MSALFDTNTWVVAAAVFCVIKLIFWYLGWLFHDKDKPLRENVEQLRDYLSKHSYFEAMRDTLARLYEHLNNYFQAKKVRFLYLFLLFLLINLISLGLGRYWFGINPAEIKTLLSSLDKVIPKQKVPSIDNGLSVGRSLVFVIQLSLLDIYSFLFTMGIIWMASRSKGVLLFFIELMTDVSILFLFYVLVFFCLNYLIIKNIFLSLVGSFCWILLIGGFIFMSYRVFRYWEQSNCLNIIHQDRFQRSLYLLVGFCLGVTLVLGATVFTYIPYSRAIFFLLVFLIPVVIFWVFRVLEMPLKNKRERVLKFTVITIFVFLLGSGSIYLIRFHRLFPLLYSDFSQALTSKLVIILIYLAL